MEVPLGIQFVMSHMYIPQQLGSIEKCVLPTYGELEGVWLRVGDVETCEGGGEGGAGEGDHLVGRGWLRPHLNLEPNVVWGTGCLTSPARHRTQTSPIDVYTLCIHNYQVYTLMDIFSRVKYVYVVV